MIVKQIFSFRKPELFSLLFSVIFCSVVVGTFFFFALFSGHCHKHRFSMLQNQSPPLLSQLGGTGMDECALPLIGFCPLAKDFLLFSLSFQLSFSWMPSPLTFYIFQAALGAMCSWPRVVWSTHYSQSFIHTLIVMHIYTFYSHPFGYKYIIAFWFHHCTTSSQALQQVDCLVQIIEPRR